MSDLLAVAVTYAAVGILVLASRPVSGQGVPGPAHLSDLTALACVDWLAAGLARISAAPTPNHIHRYDTGHIRVIEAEPSYERLVNGAFDKVRQAGRGMPAVTIRQLEALAKVMEFTAADDQRCTLMRQADMLLQSSEEAIPEPNDRLDVQRRRTW